MDYRLNSSFLPHCLLPETTQSRFCFCFVSVRSTCTRLELRCMFVCRKRFDFGADCRVVRLAMKVFVIGHECYFFFLYS